MVVFVCCSHDEGRDVTRMRSVTLWPYRFLRVRVRPLGRGTVATLVVFATVGLVVSGTTTSRASAASNTGLIELHPVAANAAFAQYRGAGYEKSVLTAEHTATRMSTIAPGPSSQVNHWTPIGPQPEANGYGGANSGRVTGLAVTPGSSPTLYLASAGGGVWSSSNGGTSWSTTTDAQPDIAMGSVAVDPSNPAYVFAGTGEDNQCLDCYFGDGVLESSNGGASWTTSNPGGLFTGTDISSVVVVPGAASISSTTVVVGASNNLYVSTDGGSTWTAESGSGWSSGNVTSIVINSLTSPLALYASVEGVGVEQSTDGGANWTTVQSLSTGESSALAIVPTASTTTTTLYESIGSLNSAGGGSYVALDKSTNGGSTWTAFTNCTTASSTSCVPYFTGDDYSYLGLNDDTGGDQSWYDNVVAVDPQNPNIIIAAGITMIESTDGGLNWTNLNGGGFSQGAPLFHPDFHALVFDSAGNLYFGNDGGAWEMTAANVATATPSYTNLNTNLDITQFYPGIAQSGNGTQVLGGTQDNGTNLYSSSNSPSTTWHQVVGGDGGYSGVDPATPAVQYAEEDVSIAGGHLVGTSNNWASSAVVTTPGFTTANWAAPLVVVPGTGGQTLLFGGNGVFTSSNGATSWTGPSGYTLSDVSALAVAPSTTSVVYAGFDNGTLEMSANGGAAWTPLTNSPLIGYDITHIAVSPTDPYTIYVTYAAGANSGFANSVSNSPGVLVGTSLNSGASWTAVTGNLPPGTATNSVISDGANGLIVATDVGVYWAASLNGASTTWTALGAGLPNVQVMDLTLTGTGTGTGTGTLIVTTHGRGAWTIPFSASTAPGAPIIGTAVAGNASASVNWSAGTNGGSAITGYTVNADDVTTNVAIPNACPSSLTLTTTTCIASGLTNADAYTFSVAAINSIGTGAFSLSSNTVTPTSGTPSGGGIGGGGGGGSTGGGGDIGGTGGGGGGTTGSSGGTGGFGGAGPPIGSGTPTGPTNAPPPPGPPSSAYGPPTSVAASCSSTVITSHKSGSDNESLTIPMCALPTNTTVSIYPINPSLTPPAWIPVGQVDIMAVAISWQAPDGSVPTASEALNFVITNPNIKPGDPIFELTPSGLREVATATSNREVTLTFSGERVYFVTAMLQSPLKISPRSGHVGSALRLIATGGSGPGRVTFTVKNGTARGCAISGNALRASRPGTCIVSAAKAASGAYEAITSAGVAVTMGLPPRPFSLTLRFATHSSALSTADQILLRSLATKLLAGASVRITGYAPHDAALAHLRAIHVAVYLERYAKVRVELRVVTRTRAQTINVGTLRQ